MAVRNVATSSTLEGFRTTFNSLGTDVGDLVSLGTTDKSSIVAAINEVNTSVSTAFKIKDSSSTQQTINTGDVFSFVGDSNITATVSATDTMTISLNSNISGLSSISGTTVNATSSLTENNVRVATRPFAIAQAVALG
tara:strand:- start:1698 stop:2111 length:414 start_codon:yes stop_codon:yes gene_type:complete